MVKKKVTGDYKYISAFLTFRCSLNCSYCLNAFSKSFNRTGFKELPGKEWVEGLNRIESRPEVPITFSGGEPFLHKDFFYIINHLDPALNIDLLTNLHWGKNGIKKFIENISPERLKRKSKYPSIRVSYHPEQMGDGRKLVENVRRLQDAGFSIGIYAVQYPSPQQLEAITQMQFRCRDNGIDFRIKDFTGVYEGKDDNGNNFSVTYGDYSRYPLSTFQKETRKCRCKTSELLIGPTGEVYRCHKDVFAGEYAVGRINDPKFKIESRFRSCDKYGQCHPCDVKVKTDYKQQLGHTSVEIRI